MHSEHTSWWKKPENINQILTMAWEIDKRYPNERIVAPGESLAWTTHTVGLKRRLEGREADVSYVAFSEAIYDHRVTGQHFVKIRRGDQMLGGEGPIYGDFQERVSPTDLLRRSPEFISMLSHTGNSPKDIVGRHQAHQQKTVFVDKVATGEGLASFCVLMDTLAEQQGVQDEFREAAHYHVYSLVHTFDPHTLQIKNVGLLPANISAVLICPGMSESDRIEGLSIDGRVTPDSSRLQPVFDISARRPQIIVPKNDAVQSEIRGLLEAAVSKATGVIRGSNFVIQGTSTPPPEPTESRRHIEYSPSGMGN